MPWMYKLGCEPINAHDSQIQNMETIGWSLLKPFTGKEKSQPKLSQLAQEAVDEGIKNLKKSI